ncbi:MAG: Rpn family recombination-promoting nuclease/putative transposase [Cyanobacteria bacterium J06626_14]
MIDHDQLFKELLSNFFLEFLELFLPELASTIERKTIRFLPQEYFVDLTLGEKKIIDLLVEVQQAGEDMAFLVHLEAQSSSEPDFARRMFFYFARLYQKYRQRVYPIVVFSFDKPYRKEPHQHKVEFPNIKVLEFNFTSIQLNRLNWRDFLHQPNPVAAALMSKMQIAPEDRPKVKAECLRVLTTLQLNPARMELISGFVDTYLRLNESEEAEFEAELDKIGASEREEIMQIVTTWMERGIEQGKQEGREEGREEGSLLEARSLVQRLLPRLVGALPASIEHQIEALSLPQLEALAEALLDFSSLSDLEEWLSDSTVLVLQGIVFLCVLFSDSLYGRLPWFQAKAS